MIFRVLLVCVLAPASAAAQPVTVQLGSNGSAVGTDGDTGQAWLVHAPDDRGRFAFSFAPSTDWILARRTSGSWFYDNNNAYEPFDPAPTDRAAFRLNLDNRTATQRAVREPLGTMGVGISSGDLTVTPDRYPDATTANVGEWHVAGTSYTYEDPTTPPEDADEAAIQSAAELEAIRLMLRFLIFLGGFWVGFAGWNQIVTGARKETPL